MYSNGNGTNQPRIPPLELSPYNSVTGSPITSENFMIAGSPAPGSYSQQQQQH